MTNSSLIQPVLTFLVGLTIASTLSVASYVVIRLLCEQSNQSGLFACGFIAAMGTAILLLITPTLLMLGGGLSVLWALATLADRAVQPSQENWLETFFKIAIASICATFLVGLLWLSIVESDSWQFLSTSEKWFTTGYWMGALFSPSVSAIFLWMWKTILLRPGIERHLREEERVTR